MNERNLLFVYGLLRHEYLGHRSLRLNRRTQYLGRARAHGRLYHLGDYPGAIFGKRGIIHGDLVAFDDAALWHELDAYELCDPDRPRASEYRRVEIDLLDSDRRVWSYEYNRPIKDRPIIASGHWLSKMS